MVADNSQAMTVSWSPYGKILTTTKAGGANLQFAYNAMQQRVIKRVSQSGDTTRTYYIRDAQGNTMGVYTRRNDSVSWREQYIFGSSRLGLYRADTLVNKGLQVISKIYEGKKNYELTNHLGNVLAVINDRKADSLSGAVKLGFNAVVISAADYFPFGMAIDSRSYTSSLYRYGFNGKENDKETGEQDYGMRIYDSKVPHFWSVDPLMKKYPQYSPYIFAGDNPIMATDLDGAEPKQAVKNNQYETPDVLASWGDYHKTGHTYMAIRASSEMYWYIRFSTNADTYGDKSFEYWDGKTYSPYIPNGYDDQKAAFKGNAIALGNYGKGVEGAVYASLAIGGGVAYASATGTSLLAYNSGELGLFAGKTLWIKTAAFAGDAIIQGALSPQKTFGGKIGDVNWGSSSSQFIFINPFTSSVIGNSIPLSANNFRDGTVIKESIIGKPVETGVNMLFGGIGNLYSGAATDAYISGGLKFTNKVSTSAGQATMGLFYNLNTNFYSNKAANATSKEK